MTKFSINHYRKCSFVVMKQCYVMSNSRLHLLKPIKCVMKKMMLGNDLSEQKPLQVHIPASFLVMVFVQLCMVCI